MKHGFLTFGLFAFSQLLLWVVSQNDNIATGGEIMFITFVISLFLVLFFAGYRWARWVATVLLGLFALVIASLTFEGFGVGFISITLLYGAIILTLFKHQAKIRSKQVSEELKLKQFAELETSVIDMDISFKSPSVPIVDGFYVGEDIYRYPLLIKRYQSVFIDSMLLFSIMVVAMVVMGESDARQTVMISLGAIFVLVYEPLLTTYAATIGQRVMGIRVRDINNPKERINLVQAYVRITVKWFLGWLSFITINFNSEHRAIHDIAGSSVVIRIK